MMKYRYLVLLALIIPLVNPILALSAVKEDLAYDLSENEDYALWWSISANKILAKKKPVGMNQNGIQISAARNEYESFQLVMFTKRDIRVENISVSNFTAGKNKFLSDKNVEILKVDYVPVINPTDALGQSGNWPDPLMPVTFSDTSPLALKGNENHIFWFNIYVPEKANAGNYTAYIRIKLFKSNLISEVPLQLRVYNFTLPKETHTRTAYGVNVNNDWHRLEKPEDFRTLYDSYLQVLYKRRICPMNPMAYAPVKVNLIPIKDGETVLDYKVDLDFSEFDKAGEYYLDQLGFNAFNFPIATEYEGLKAFNEDYKRQAKKIFGAQINHLRQKNWLSKAYCYWIDEPDLNNTPISYVQDGMKFLKEVAPELKRLLTLCKAPAPDARYYDMVNLWAPVMSCFSNEAAQARQLRSEEVWWYVCTVPRTPYANNFIDHPALEHRMRYWMMEKYNVQGDLYWTTTFWSYRNPYEDASSYVDANAKDSYGNGDGLLLYPPTKTPPKEALMAPPNPSIRLEMIRDGLEDREYFWVLRQEIARIKTTAQYDKAKNLLKEAEWIKQEPNVLIKSLKEFEKDPLKLYHSRQKVALMIEKFRQQ